MKKQVSRALLLMAVTLMLSAKPVVYSGPVPGSDTCVQYDGCQDPSGGLCSWFGGFFCFF